jgi:hypothetical protein
MVWGCSLSKKECLTTSSDHESVKVTIVVVEFWFVGVVVVLSVGVGVKLLVK